MQLHPNHKGVQTFGCRLLMNLSSGEQRGEETGLPTDSKRAVLTAGGIEAALTAVAAFPALDDLIAPALKGCAYVEFNSTRDADAAARRNGELLKGRPIRLDWGG